MSRWTAQDIGPQNGKTVLITGASSGLGLASAKVMNEKGARVIAAVRNLQKAREVLGHDIEIRELNLSELSSVKKFANELNEDIDILINNAGVMAIPLARNSQGHEMQFATNHLGHFVLTGLILDRVKDRVISVSSIMHKMGEINFDDINSETKYNKWTAYGQSKLANLLFTLQLDKYIKDVNSNIKALAVHPGYSDTNLQANSSRGKKSAAMALANKLFAQSAEQGALPTLFAATQNLPSNSYVGPDGLFESKGYPKLVGRSKKAKDYMVAEKLWKLSEELTGIKFNF